VIEETHTDRQSTLLVRTEEPIIDPAWSVEEVSLEDIVLAYMGRVGGSRSDAGLAGTSRAGLSAGGSRRSTPST
jgi:hypothetical protein